MKTSIELINGVSYTVTGYELDTDTQLAGLLLVKAEMRSGIPGSISASSDVAMVKSVNKVLDDDEEQVLQITLLEDGEATEETPAGCTCTEKCEAGAVNAACPVCSIDSSICTGKEAELQEAEQPQEEETDKSNTGMVLIVLVLIGLGGAAFYYFKVIKPKKDTAKGTDNLDEYEFDEYEEEQPEETDEK